MWDIIRTKENAYFTVEAAVMFPFLIFLTVFIFYVLIYVYDRVLVLQDMNALEASLKTSESDFYYAYKEIESEHPYFAVDNVNIQLEDSKEGKKITIKCRWQFPMADHLNQEIELTRIVKVLNPYAVMVRTEGLISNDKESEDDKNKSNQ